MCMFSKYWLRYIFLNNLKYTRMKKANSHIETSICKWTCILNCNIITLKINLITFKHSTLMWNLGEKYSKGKNNCSKNKILKATWRFTVGSGTDTLPFCTYCRGLSKIINILILLEPWPSMWKKWHTNTEWGKKEPCDIELEWWVFTWSFCFLALPTKSKRNCVPVAMSTVKCLDLIF